MTNIRVLTNIANTNVTTNWTGPTQRITILDTTQVRYPRAVMLTTNGVLVTRGSNAAGIGMNTIIQAAVSIDPALTWPPMISNQPNNTTVADPNPASFSITAAGEIDAAWPLSYQWRVSSNSGTTFSNVTDGGIYSNATNNHLNISNSRSMNANVYMCRVWNAAGNTNSNHATLTVTV